MYVSLIVVVLSLALLGSNERWGGVEAVEAQPAPGIDLPNKQEELHILRTWIQDTEFTSRLPSILYQCAHPSSVEKALSAAECNVARFLHFHNSIAAPATSTPATAGTSRNLKVDSIPMDSPYPTIFEDYIAKNRILKRNLGNECKQVNYDDLYFHSEEMQHWPWLRSLQSELDDSLASQVTVPLLASNNLYPQLTKSSQDMIHSNVEDHCMDKPCMLDLNQAQKGKEKTQAYQCPLRGHLLVWGVDSSLTFQIHEEKIASLLEVTVPLNISTSGVHFPKLFAKNLFDTDLSTAAGNKAAGSLIAGESMFIPNNYLVSFRVSDETPRTRAMMLCVVDASNLNAFRQELHSHAYVSAEHAYILNDVTRLMSIARVATSTAAGEAAALMNKQPKDCLPLADYQAGKGNKGSNGEEAAAEAVPVNTRNRKNKGKQKNFKVWQDSIQWKTLLDSLMIPAASTPHIAKMSRNTITLTWKQAFVPVDSDQTAFGFRLQLCALPKVTVDDSSGTPQQIMHAHHIVGKSEAEGKFVLQVNSENSVHQCVDREYLRSNEGFVESASLQDVAQGVVNFDLVLDNLLPDTFYQVRASIVYGSKLGPMSEWSEVLFTRPITPPSTPQPPKNLLRTEDDDGLILQVTNDHQLFAEAHPSLVQISFAAKIHFSPSTDDGGDALIGYMVYSRIVNRGHFYNEWVKHGIYSAQRTPEGNAFVLVHNLIPQLSYAFKVSAVNSLGESKPSNVSNTVRIESFAILANHSQPFGRYGVGFQSAYGEETSRFLNSAEESARIASGLSIDHDMTGVVEVNLIDEFISAWKLQDQTPLAEISLPLWRCHWSYPMQSVIGVMKEVTDFNDHHDEGEDNQLSKSTEFVGKIAVVHRGTLPLYQLALHAQRMGALAVLIVEQAASSTPHAVSGFTYICVDYDQRCIPGGNKYLREGFAGQDMPQLWSELRIPVAFVRKQIYEDLQNAIIRIQQDRSTLLRLRQEEVRAREEAMKQQALRDEL